MTNPRHTRVCIFTPTQRPGFDVSWHSVRRQKTDADIKWIVCDELAPKRHPSWAAMTGPDVVCGKYEFELFTIAKEEGNARNLAAAYNYATHLARDWGADLFISLQDYIYVPQYGVQRFVEMYEALEVENETKGIYTGICSISSDPGVEEIHDIGAPFSIFKESYDKRPIDIEWMDVRYQHNDGDYLATTPIEWETNWAAIPEAALYDDRLSFDEDFDKAVAYENQAYAKLAEDLGYTTILHNNNHAISLPHKKYFHEEWAVEEPLTLVNQKLAQEKYGL